MAELDAATIIGYLNQIDAQIQACMVGLGSGGLGSVQQLDYKIGQVEIKGSQRLESLMKAREIYQTLLEKIPATTADVVTYDIGVDGRDRSDLLGDE